MFIGTHLPKLDDKSRLIFPAKFRDQIHENVVLTRGHEHCIAVYRESDFLKQAELLAKGSTTSAAVREYSRAFLANSDLQTFDGQGRIGIGAKLREWAGINKDLAVVGLGDRIEIWDLTRWDEYDRRTAETFASKSEEVIPGIF
ncbi:MAG: transcriptional regulator MraZ [Actinomycetota bacterium]|jgi:MraZ protein